jgi:hypothetical protein
MATIFLVLGFFVAAQAGATLELKVIRLFRNFMF